MLCVSRKRTGHALSALSSHDLHTEQTETHFVEPGEALWTIAWSVDEKHNTRDVVDEIERLNGLCSSEIKPGEVLVVPSH